MHGRPGRSLRGAAGRSGVSGGRARVRGQARVWRRRGRRASRGGTRGVGRLGGTGWRAAGGGRVGEGCRWPGARVLLRGAGRAGANRPPPFPHPGCARPRADPAPGPAPAPDARARPPLRPPAVAAAALARATFYRRRYDPGPRHTRVARRRAGPSDRAAAAIGPGAGEKRRRGRRIREERALPRRAPGAAPPRVVAGPEGLVRHLGALAGPVAARVDDLGPLPSRARAPGTPGPPSSRRRLPRPPDAPPRDGVKSNARHSDGTGAVSSRRPGLGRVWVSEFNPFADALGVSQVGDGVASKGPYPSYPAENITRRRLTTRQRLHRRESRSWAEAVACDTGSPVAAGVPCRMPHDPAVDNPLSVLNRALHLPQRHHLVLSVTFVILQYFEVQLEFGQRLRV